MRYHGHIINLKLRKIKSLATRRVFDEIISDMTQKRSNSIRIDKEDRQSIANRAECSHTQVVNSLKELVDVEILDRPKRGMYRVDPRCIYTGHSDSQTVDIELYRERKRKRLLEQAAKKSHR